MTVSPYITTNSAIRVRHRFVDSVDKLRQTLGLVCSGRAISS